MKNLTFNNEIYQAKRIVKTDSDIIGYNGNTEVFAFRGISDFSQFALDEGQEWDIDEKTELQKRISDLETLILQLSGVI